MKIKTRLILSYALVSVVFGMFLGYSFIVNKRNTVKIREIKEDYDYSNIISDIRFGIMEIQESYLASCFKNDLDESYENFDEAAESMENVKKNINLLIASDYDKVDYGKLKEIAEQLDQYGSNGLKMAKSFLKGNNTDYFEHFLNMDTSFDHFIEIVEKIQNTVDSETGKMVNDVLYSLKRSSIIIVILISITAVVLMIVLFFTLNSLLKPLNLLVKVSNSIAEGDLTAEVDYNKNDELGVLGANLNKAIAHLHENLKNMQDTSTAIVSVKDKLRNGTEEASSAINEISANNQSMKNLIEKLNSNIMDATGSVEEITSNIESLVNLINDHAIMVQQATSSVTEMSESINNVAAITESKRESTALLVESANTGGEKLDITNNIIKSVAGRIGDIHEMMEIINGISSQTNLLSMNAAIEAAHAGDVGKGFAVVADEIRKLAESTATNAKKISSVIDEITDNIESALNSGEITRNAFEAIIKEIKETEAAYRDISASAKELAGGGSEILQAMTNLSDVSENIRKGTVEMKKDSKQVMEAMNSVEQISGVVTNGMNEVARGIEDISNTVEDINQMARKLGENSDNLDSVIKQFKV